MKTCNRCGACCISGPCGAGVENDDYMCIYLIVNSDKTTSCQLILEGKMPDGVVGLGKGCNLQKDDSIYKFYREQAEEYKNELLT